MIKITIHVSMIRERTTVIITNLVGSSGPQILVEARDKVLTSLNYLRRLSSDPYRHLLSCHDEGN